MFLNNQETELMCEAQQALQKLNNQQNSKKDLLVEFQNNWTKYDKGRAYFEEYTPESFQSKIKIDLLYMDQLLQKLDNDQINEVEKLISSLYKDVKEIYEFLNVKPEIYGKNITEELINENNENIKGALSKNIYKYLSNRFYDLPVEKRESLYFERTKEDSRHLISEGQDAETAVEFSIKKCLMEDFVRNICFPPVIRNRLNYILEDDAFGDLFDQNALHDVYNSYNKKLNSISKIIAVCV